MTGDLEDRIRHALNVVAHAQHETDERVVDDYPVHARYSDSIATDGSSPPADGRRSGSRRSRRTWLVVAGLAIVALTASGIWAFREDEFSEVATEPNLGSTPSSSVEEPVSSSFTFPTGERATLSLPPALSAVSPTERSVAVDVSSVVPALRPLQLTFTSRSRASITELWGAPMQEIGGATVYSAGQASYLVWDLQEWTAYAIVPQIPDRDPQVLLADLATDLRMLSSASEPQVSSSSGRFALRSPSATFSDGTTEVVITLMDCSETPTGAESISGDVRACLADGHALATIRNGGGGLAQLLTLELQP
jgi:hypothetical protein